MSESEPGAVVADEIELRPFYHDIKSTIVQPKQVVVGSRYFWEKWAPRLGPTLTVLIVRLRLQQRIIDPSITIRYFRGANISQPSATTDPKQRGQYNAANGHAAAGQLVRLTANFPQRYDAQQNGSKRN